MKPYGLSIEPTISHITLTPEDKFVIIASDGLWDTLPLKNICEITYKSYQEYKLHPGKGMGAAYISNELVNAALKHMPLTTVRDNISVIILFFESDALQLPSIPNSNSTHIRL